MGGDPIVEELDPSGNRVLSIAFQGGVSYRAIPVGPGGLIPPRWRAGMDAMAPRRDGPKASQSGRSPDLL